MGLTEIVENLQKLLGVNEDPAAKQIEALHELLKKLKKKEAKYRRKLDAAKTEKEHKKIERHLKTCSAQLKKGKAALKTLKENAG